MTEPNGSGTSAAPEDDPDRTQRIPNMQEVVDEWFPEEPVSGAEQGQPFMVANRQARRMTGRPKQPSQKPTTASRDDRYGCWFSTLAPAAVAVLVAWAAR